MEKQSNEITDPIPPDIGGGMEFPVTQYKETHGPAVTVPEFNREGKREATLELSTWVGTSALGAVHWYARIKWHGCTFTKPDGSPHPQANSWPNGMPDEAERGEIRITREVTQRDVTHAKRTRPGESFMWPRSGDWTTGFWTEDEAKEAALEFFRTKFLPGWVLLTHNQEGDLVEIAAT